MELESSYLTSLGEVQDWFLLTFSPLGFPMLLSYLNLWEMGIILNKGPISLIRVAKMTLMVPKDGHGAVSLWRPKPDCSPCPNGWCMNCFRFPALANWFRKSRRVLQSLVVWPRSWWYWQYRLWFYLVRPPLPNLIRPLKVRLTFDLLQHLIYKLFEYGVYCMCIMLGCLVKELPSQPVGSKTIKSRISLFWCENLSLSFTLDLVVFYLFVLLYPIHQLVHILCRLHSERFS